MRRTISNQQVKGKANEKDNLHNDLLNDHDKIDHDGVSFLFLMHKIFML
jgi:hypothetical protein